ncbi:uncharacterized protein LOC114249531 isoform X4 [Bombyx mandarina]|uniref:Uncharacterized protein LOC114249531 isoform X1 n=1 Tax=Bombyx mandarina TaxID=7092 RepID=A0A6J2KBA6_BOMMA|nr:uncharacterized protein LOC114249531 isoform X1 [Bombyx mandarina]XP_028038946.1 uncharacterized protein LOC114249531 isoform X2 [Bombyx mandarina]XP_028038947.1 uncharacterized protein LOC114249531 isoform X3 [Bombyx mandarina]XP_028038948.1 uncharacterized protein LOC114249531 isoform X4 [Bombyx mandarina]
MARLRKFVKDLRPTPASRHGGKRTFVFKDLATASHIFLRDDTLGGSLKQAYSGPHEVLQRGDKVFRIILNGKNVAVSIDRIKPAYILHDSDTTHTPSPTHTYTHTDSPDTTDPVVLDADEGVIRRTRSGRRVKFPQYYRP